MKKKRMRTRRLTRTASSMRDLSALTKTNIFDLLKFFPIILPIKISSSWASDPNIWLVLPLTYWLSILFSPLESFQKENINPSHDFKISVDEPFLNVMLYSSVRSILSDMPVSRHSFLYYNVKSSRTGPELMQSVRNKFSMESLNPNCGKFRKNS